MNQHLEIAALEHKYNGRSLNEADTRAKVIDTVLENVLSWPKSAIKRELSINPGYADYVLHNAAGQAVLVVEAKREGVWFTLPKQSGFNQNSPYHTSVRTLITDVNIKEAINQARSYCLDIGCTFGCITNGHEWIVFRAFEPGTDWKGLRAYVIPSLSSMNTSFTEFHNSLSYKCVCFDGSLNELISRTPLENRESYRPANDIPVYARTMDSHKYVQYLRPIANRFFGQIEAEATELMTNCYVSDVNYDSAYKSAQVLLVDSVTPYLEEYGVKDTKNDENGGGFGNRIKRNIIKEPKADVVVLFGGKGIGKSTFLRRLLYVNPPQVIKKNAVIALIDLLEIPEDKKLIDEHIWKELIRNMDIDNLLSGRRDQLVELFSDRYKTAIKQELFGFDETSADFNKTLNALIGLWKEDYKYVTKRLSIYLRGKHKGVVVVLDNTDQYRGLQEYCFTHAQQIAKALNCLVIISMREERFYASTIRGVLDAFQNSGFHLSSPSPQNVFLKRIDFVQRLISNTARRYDIVPEDMPLDDIETMQKFLRNLSNEFRLEQSHLSGFLSACAHGNIRLALELFRGLIQSRYTNIDEITSKKDWKWQIHQVLKPIMIPNRFFYEESQSHIPNIFQIRSKKRSSHFTTLRILSALTNHSEKNGSSFYSLPKLIADLSNRFHMEDDQRYALDILLGHGMIESNNRLDEYAETIDSIRSTAYGNYIYDELSSAFTYLDLVSTDTSVFDSGVCNEISLLAQQEYSIWQSYNSNAKTKRIERVEVRIKKTLAFIEYLDKEETKEASLYQLTSSERFMPKIKERLNAEIDGVRRSANRQRY